MSSKDEAAAFEDAKQTLVDEKTSLKEAREELKSFMKEHKLKKGKDHSEHETKKVGKGWTKLNNSVSKAEEKVSKTREFLKANKPKKDRVSKYTYPDGLDAEGRKTFRTQMRAKAKRAGMTPDEYLSDTKAGDKIIAEKDAEKAEKRAAKASKKKTEKKDTKKSDKKVPKPKKRPKKSKAAEEDED